MVVIGIGMLTLAGQTLHSRIGELEQLASASAPQRIAAYLLDRARGQGERLELPLSQRRNWEIRDPAGLRRLTGKTHATHGPGASR